MGTKGNIRMAVRNLRRNKTRSGLTMLGVIIGVLSVVLIVSIGEGVKRQINDQAYRLGGDLITIRPGQPLSAQRSDVINGLLGLTQGRISDSDIQHVAKTQGVDRSVPLSVVHSGVVSNERSKPSSLLVLGTTADFPTVTRQTLSFGEFFSDDATASDKAILGSKAASTLFDERVPLGQTLNILGHQFIVEGILNDFSTPPLANDADFNDAVFISYNSAEAITNDNSPIYEILARPADQSKTADIANNLRKSLQSAHGGQTDFTVLTPSDEVQSATVFVRLLTMLIAGVATIALVVGGVGIMNVMLVAVTERMHEIGIRKAVGATNRQIMAQFLTESAVLSLMGGFIGLLLSFFAAGAIALLTSITPVISWQIVALATGVSVGIGILFGSMPAMKAARKDPIAALRNE